MKYIITIVKKLWVKESPNPLGRWKIEYCNKTLNNKIDLSNEDHCGQYILKQNKTNKDK